AEPGASAMDYTGSIRTTVEVDRMSRIYRRSTRVLLGVAMSGVLGLALACSDSNNAQPAGDAAAVETAPPAEEQSAAPEEGATGAEETPAPEEGAAPGETAPPESAPNPS